MQLSLAAPAFKNHGEEPRPTESAYWLSFRSAYCRDSDKQERPWGVEHLPLPRLKRCLSHRGSIRRFKLRRNAQDIGRG